MKKESGNNKEGNKKSMQCFLNVLLGILYFSIIGMIICSFIFESVVIDGKVVTLVLILVILTLSGRFDNFSIGKLFTVSKNLKEKAKENEILRSENIKLRNNLYNQNSNQMNNYYQSPDKKNVFEDPTPDEIKEKEQQDTILEEQEIREGDVNEGENYE